MRAIMYGAGNIGRGFIAPLLVEAGYCVSFVDVNEAIIDALNTDHAYPQEIIGQQDHTHWVKDVDGILGTDEKEVVEAISQADLLATAVGANVLIKIAPRLAKGLALRWQQDENRKLDILICENLMHADQILKQAIIDSIDSRYVDLVDSNVGFVETAIGRMVPVMNEERQRGNILRICVEAYDYLPVDQDAFKNPIPNHEKIIAYSPFSYYLERKLYVHNMAHYMTALLGKKRGYTYIADAIKDAKIRLLVQKAALESCQMISKRYGVSFIDLYRHVQDLLDRFENSKLKDTVARVARDPMRKLQPEDRLVGAFQACLKEDIMPVYIGLAISYALPDLDALENICHIQKGDVGYDWIQAFVESEDPVSLAKQLDSQLRGRIV